MERLVLWLRVFPPTRPDQDVPEVVERWTRQVSARFLGAGGSPLGRLGGSVAVAFDLTELTDALDVALALLDEGEESTAPPGGLRLSCGAATGVVVEHSDGTFGGSAIDRAQLLANRARRGELVLDADTRRHSESTFLFGRSVGTGAAALRGTAIDRTVPHRATCRFAIAYLEPPPVAPTTEEALAPLRTIAERNEGTDRVALRGPSGAGATGFLRQLEREIAPPLLLRFAGVPGALEPFGAFRLALLRTFETPERIEEQLGDQGPVLSAVAKGVPVRKEDVASTLHRLVHRTGAAGRPWFVFDPLPSVDPTTLALVAEVSESSSCLVVARAPVDASLPGPFGKLAWQDFLLPVLRLEDAKVIAKAVLSDQEGEVARRVAVLGGDTPLGVVEAARMLVASGDLVHDGDGFVWRVNPRAGVRALPVDTLLHDRLRAMEDQPLRMLEAVCLCPPGTPTAVIDSIAERDNLLPDQRDDATSRLRQEALVFGIDRLEPSSELLRRLVLRNMPPGRMAELYRFLAEGMGEDPLYGGALVKASIGWYWNEAGYGKQGARAVLESAEGALEAGLDRAARRLAAAAVQMDHSPEVRSEATRISRAAAGETETDESEPGRVSQVAIHALLAGDIDKVERTIETAIAEGRDLAAADRMRAMAYLAKGDTAQAMAAFARLQKKRSDGDLQRARTSLTLAWILMHAGDADQAIRAAMQALASSRRMKDPRGEAAALHTLAAAYRSLGRESEATQIAEVSPA